MATISLALILILVSLQYSNLYSRDYYWSYGNEKLGIMETWMENNVGKENKITILAQEYYMREARVAAENSLHNPKKQMTVNPNREEFETNLMENSVDYYLMVDNKSGQTNFWLYSHEILWESYLEGLGFEKEAEFESELSGTYSIYKRTKG